MLEVPISTQDSSPLDETRAAALGSSSLDAITAKLVDNESAAPFGQPGDKPLANEGVIHPMGFIDSMALAFQVIRATAQDSGDRAFVDALKKLSDARTPMPWTVRGPAFRSAVQFTGVEPFDDEAEKRFRAILSLAAPLLTSAAPHAPKPITRRYVDGTLIGRVRSKLDGLSHGTAIPHGRRQTHVSWPGLAALMDIPLPQLKRSMQIRDEVHARLKDGRLVLGRPYMKDGNRYKAIAPARDRLIKVIEAYADEPRRPIAIEPRGKGKYLMDPLLDEAEVNQPWLRDLLTIHQKVRKTLTQVVAIVGTRRASGPVEDMPPLLTFGDLIAAGTKEAEDAFRVRNPEADEHAVRKAGVNEVTFINRAMGRNGWLANTDVAPTLLGPDAKVAINKGLKSDEATVHRSDSNYLNAMARWSRFAAAMLASRQCGVTFARRLAHGIRKSQLSTKKFAELHEIPYNEILRWCRGTILPSSHQLHFVHRIEKAFGQPKGELIATLGIVRGGRNNTQRKSVKLEDGRTVGLTKYLPFLPADALDWPEERLSVEVMDADRRHFGAQTINSVRQKGVAYAVRNHALIDPDSPILKEWQDLELFKTALNDPDRFLSPKWEWRSTRSVEMNRIHMENFARWCALPVAEGGLGLPAHQISFILFLNHQVIAKYVFYRICRFSHLTLKGEELGPMLGATEFIFLGFVQSLLDAEYGWITQSRHIVKKPEPIDVQFHLERMSALDGNFTVEMPIDAEKCTVMTPELVESIESDWMASVRRARQMVQSLKGKVARHYTMIRNPHELVRPILNHTHPVAVVVRQVKDALARARPIEVHRRQHAIDYRNAVAMLLLCSVVFRAETMHTMEWRADGTGNLIRTATGYDVVVGPDRFKNGFCEWLFGPSYRRQDYERALGGDWGSLNDIFDYYLKVCRPILLDGRDSDLLFPTGSKKTQRWTSKTFNAMITNWTRMWSVRNNRHGTGMTGVLPWGPHCIRDIVATHIILHYPTEERWNLAATVLCTGVESVKKNYAFVNTRRELAKADHIFKEIFALGFGDEDLSSLQSA